MMISGSVDVYSPIGGNNVGVSTYSNDATINGSTASNIPPEYISPGYVSISWQYPGGIINKSYGNSGLWGYLLSAQSVGGTITTDVELTQYLYEQGYLDEDKQIKDQAATYDVINRLVSDYYVRVLEIDETQENLGQYGIQAFKNAFDGCYYIHK